MSARGGGKADTGKGEGMRSSRDHTNGGPIRSGPAGTATPSELDADCYRAARPGGTGRGVFEQLHARDHDQCPEHLLDDEAGLSAAAVRVLQAGLAKVGCYSGKIDGTSGPFTTQAVRAFQNAHAGLTVDGVYGSMTKAKLLAADRTGTRICPKSPSSTTTSSTAPVNNDHGTPHSRVCPRP